MADQLEEIIDEYEQDETEESDFPVSYNLNSFGIDFDVNGLVRRQNAGSIYLPDFQRNYVWSKGRASKFIESLLLGLPIPSICLYKEEDNKQIIIDGFQRLESIRLFYNGTFADGSKFKLTSVSKPYSNKSFSELPESARLKLDDTLIHATVVKADDPREKNYNAVYLIFERLNTGGVKLTPQEIRSCVYHGAFQNVLEKLSQNETFKKLFGISQKRKKDQELVLRLLALTENYDAYSGNMQAFLNGYMNDKKNCSETMCENEINFFNKTISILDNLPREIFKPSKILNFAIIDALFVATILNLKNNIEIENQIEKYKVIVDNLTKKSSFKKNIETGKTHHSIPLKERIRFATKEISKIKDE